MDRHNPKSSQQGKKVQQKQNVDPIIGEAVGGQLKSLFDEFASEAVPDRFRDLIEQLERLEAAEALEKDGPSSEKDDA